MPKHGGSGLQEKVEIFGCSIRTLTIFFLARVLFLDRSGRERTSGMGQGVYIWLI